MAPFLTASVNGDAESTTSSDEAASDLGPQTGETPSLAPTALPESVTDQAKKPNGTKPVGKLTKEDRAKRSAALEEERVRLRDEHDNNVAELLEEIAYQQALLRSRREEKRRKRRVDALRERLERLSRKVSNDSDYETDDDPGYESDQTNKPPPEASEPNCDDWGFSKKKMKKKKKKGKSTENAADPDSTQETGPDTQDASSENGDGEKKEEDEAQDKEEDAIPDPNKWPVATSKAKLKWEEQKSKKDEENRHLDALMDLVGLESVKSRFMDVKDLVDVAKRQDVDLAKDRFGAVFIGKPGSGKKTVANLYAKFLGWVGIVQEEAPVRETTGVHLASGGISELKRVINSLKDDYPYETKGVVLITQAQSMLSDGSGPLTLEYLLSEADRLRGKVAFLFTGPPREMQLLMGASPRFRGQIPFTFAFDDYTDSELHQLLVKELESKFDSKMRVEGGMDGRLMRIVTRRIGRGRSRNSFANAREVQNTVFRILLRQAARLTERLRLQQEADDRFLSQEDLIGPAPAAALENSAAWGKLQGMIGLESVKKSVQALIGRLQVNYDRELAEQPLVESSLNKVFLGNPGTGKTTVAKYYGQILVDLGLLSNGEVIIKNPSDFIGGYMGQTENITKSILESARGKVLIIDEAYGLSGATGDSNGSASGNSYRAAVVDTLVAEVQSTATEDRAVLLLGYRERMEDMFQSTNPALGRRFPLSSAFEFDDYSDEQMREILEQKMQAQGFTASDRAKKVAMDVLMRCRNHRNFGNAGEIDILLDRAKECQQSRLLALGDNDNLDGQMQLEEVDFDADFDRGDTAEANIRDAFRDFVGAEDLVAKFESYRRITENSKQLDLDPRSQIPFNFIFRGPPGTGKTTTARKVGQVFFDMGFLATNEVEECSVTDLIGEFVGQTGPKTQKVFQRALGKVLFIDEAYGLADRGGRFGKEALTEMINILTLPKYKNKLVTILAGYDEDINKLLTINPGIGSRFPEVINFPPLSPSHSYELLLRRLQEYKLDVGNLRSQRVEDRIKALFVTLASLPAWGNARDIETLAKDLFGKVISCSGQPPILLVPAEMLYDEMERVASERRKRAGDAVGRPEVNKKDEVEEVQCDEPAAPLLMDAPTTVQRHASSHSILAAEIQASIEAISIVEDALATPWKESSQGKGDGREPGCSDEIWAALQVAKAAAIERRANLEGLADGIARLETGIRTWESSISGGTVSSKQLERMGPELENMRKALQSQKTTYESAKSELEREMEVQSRLIEAGMCDWGYEWVKESDGYRCSGGVCFKSHDDIWNEYGL